MLTIMLVEVVGEVVDMVGEVADMVREVMDMVGEVTDMAGEVIEMVGEVMDLVGTGSDIEPKLTRLTRLLGFASLEVLKAARTLAGVGSVVIIAAKIF